jgi:hypothetical protein
MSGSETAAQSATNGTDEERESTENIDENLIGDGFVQPENRSVGSSILPLATTNRFTFTYHFVELDLQPSCLQRGRMREGPTPTSTIPRRHEIGPITRNPIRPHKFSD